jgi:hypothetical protein
MRRWRKQSQEDSVLTFDDLEAEDEAPRARRRSIIHTRFDSDDEGDDEDDEEPESSSFDRLAPLVRAGKYRPKQSDPYTVHILYQSLRDLGEI